MPVPTQTYRNKRLLNPIFAFSALLLLVGTLLIVGEEQLHAWRSYQRQSKVWEAALLRDPVNELTSEESADLQRLAGQIAELEAELQRQGSLAALQQQAADAQAEIDRSALPLAAIQGEIGPIRQQIEMAKLAGDTATEQARRERLAALQGQFNERNAAMVQFKQKLAAAEEAIRAEQDRVAQLQRAKADLERKQASLQEKIAAADPQGQAALGEFLRNRVFLVNWANPNETVQQVVVPDIRTDLNFVTVDTIDRCASCHFNIDKPSFERAEIVRFTERQLARYEQQDLSDIEQPVVHLSFWLRAAAALDGAGDTAVESLLTQTRDRLNRQLTAAGMTAVADNAALADQLGKVAKSFGGSESVSRAAMYGTASRFAADLRALIREHAGETVYNQLLERYRVMLVNELNSHRAAAGLKKLDPSPVLLAHPRLDLYVETESRHPVKTMGCTSCHEGSGQETIFEHSAHTPREMWVDAADGTPVADLLVMKVGSKQQIMALINATHQPTPAAEGAKVADAHEPRSGGAGSEGDAHASHAGHRYSQQDVNLLTPDAPGKLGPNVGATMTDAYNTAAFSDPAADGKPRMAVRQSAYWTKKFGWHAIHYMHWEKPMHSLEYIESSCNKCHTEIFDIKDAAPRLFEGRALFASLGCVNCHSVDSLKDDPDVFVDPAGPNPHIRKVGPSLQHIDSKLSAQMIANWIWSPKAFRPTSRMPHFFMLENNSAPIDILRTRTEVTAMTYALMHGMSPAEQQVMALQVEFNDLRGEKTGLEAELDTLRGIERPEVAEGEAPGDPPQADPALEAANKPRIDAINQRLTVINSRLPQLPRAIHMASRDAKPYTPEPLPEDLGAGDAHNGRAIFNAVGCLACHTNMAEHGKEWIVNDLVKRELLGEDQAAAKYESMSYNQQQTYAKLHLDDKFVNVGPELSGIGTKLKAARSTDQARAWLYDWLRNPQHYNADTIMPSFRLTPEEANDLTTYLLTLERPTGDLSDSTTDEYVIHPFGFTADDKLDLDQDTRDMLRLITANLLAAQITPEMAMDEVQAGEAPVGGREGPWSVNNQLKFVGQKMISTYGCSGCHVIDGFETAAAAGTNLDDWGLKDPHKLDFGYFYAAYTAAREQPYTIHKVDHEGLAANASTITAEDVQRVKQHATAWEHMDLERRPWLYYKLHNTRVYDRGRNQLDGDLDKFRANPADATAFGRPYDKLRMPKFFLKDEQVQSIVTFVTSIRKPLVTDTMRQSTYSPDKMLETRGRQVATVFNCYGCHNIEGNHVHIQEFFDVFNDDGSFNYTNLNNAPPRLVGQGSKTQPAWLFQFMQNVHPLRPWLKVRMPSFQLTHGEATGIVEYFAGSSRTLATDLSQDLSTVHAFMRSNPDSRWYDARPTSRDANLAGLSKPLGHLREFALQRDLVAARDLDPLQSTEEELAAKYAEMVRKVSFLSDLNDVPYPFPPTPAANISDERFARGYRLFTSMGCNTCHALGNSEALQQLWEMDQSALGDTMGGMDGDDEDYGYEDDPYGEPMNDAAADADAEEDYGYGDDDGYGESETPDAATSQVPPFLRVQPGPVYSAPNLAYTHRRIQWNWFYNWLQEPATIQPGTAMPQWFPGPVTSPHNHPLSAFHAYPAEVKAQMEEMYGYTGPEQIQLLMDFVYAAGARNFTPGIERLTGATVAEIELKPLEKPTEDELAMMDFPVDTGSADAGGGDAGTGGATTGGTQAVEVAAVERQDEEVKPWEGNRVVGRIKLDRRAPRRPLRMSNQECQAMHDGPVLDPALTTSADNGLINAFVYVKALPANVSRTPLVANPHMTQEACLYEPRVMGVVAGQTLEISNGDAFLHNVNIQSSDNGRHNFGQPVKGMVNRVPMRNVEMAVQLKCDVHPWMAGFVHVMDHPYFGVTDSEGWFEIVGLPAGTYTVEVWHEDRSVRPTTFDITVTDNESRRMGDVVVGG